MHKCLRRTKSTRQVNQSLVMTQLKSVSQAIPCISLVYLSRLNWLVDWLEAKALVECSKNSHGNTKKEPEPAERLIFWISSYMSSNVVKCQETSHGNSHQTESMVKGKIWTIPHFSSKHHSTTGSRTSRRRRAMLWRHLTRLDLVFLMCFGSLFKALATWFSNKRGIAHHCTNVWGVTCCQHDDDTAQQPRQAPLAMAVDSSKTCRQGDQSFNEIRTIYVT